MSIAEYPKDAPVSISHKSQENSLAKQIATPSQINYLIYVASETDIADFLSKLLQVIEGNLSYVSSGIFPDEETKNRINLTKADNLQALHGILYYLSKKDINNANAGSIKKVAVGITQMIEKILAIRKIQPRDISFLTHSKEDAQRIITAVDTYWASTQANISTVQDQTGKAMDIITDAEARDLVEKLEAAIAQIESANNGPQGSGQINIAIANLIKTVHYQKLVELRKDRSTELGKLANKALFLMLENMDNNEVGALL